MTDPKTKKAMSSAKEQRDKLQPKPRAPKPPVEQPSPSAGVLRQNAKAIAALLTPAVAFVATKAGLHLDSNVCAGIATGLTSVVVYLVPNARTLVSSTQQKG